MPIRRGSAKKKHAARRAWLSAQDPDRYRDVPGIHDDVTAAGLFGASTPPIQREALRRLVSELRGERVDVGW